MNLLPLALPLLATLGVFTFSTTREVAPAPLPASAVAAPQGGPHQGPHCNLRSLRGDHGFTYDGTILGIGPIASSGPIRFDGQGNLSATYSTMVNGVLFRGTFVGTYTVNADGSGTVTLNLPRLGLQALGDFVLIDDGKGTFFSCTDAGFPIRGQTRRQ